MTKKKTMQIKDSTMEHFVMRRKIIHAAGLFLWFLIVWLSVKMKRPEMVWFSWLTAPIFWFVLIVIAALRNPIMRRFRQEWIAQIFFEVLFLSSAGIRKSSSLIRRLYKKVRLFSIALFFVTTWVFLWTNWKSTFQWFISIYHGDMVTAEKFLFTDTQNINLLVGIYVFILVIILLQKSPSLFKVWKRYAGIVFTTFMISVASVGIFSISKDGVMQAPSEWFLYPWMIGTVISEFLMIVGMSSKELPAQWLHERSFLGKYTMGPIHSSESENDVEIFNTYQTWKNRRNSYPEFLKNSIPYLLDTPITSSAKDVLWSLLKDKAEEIFQYIIDLELDKHSHSVIVWIDWARWSGKTSLTNILQNEYLAYARDQILTFQFRAWSYPKGSVIEGFLQDFWKFCIGNGIDIEEDLKYYVDALSKLHDAFWVLNVFTGTAITDAERVLRISTAIRESKKRIVIIIDDLDRVSDGEDLEAILKLLRSTADFYGVFYVLNYSSEEFLDKTSMIWALKDFEEKFLNWHVVMPTMKIIGLWQSKEAQTLEAMMREELRVRGWKVIDSILTNKKEYIEAKTSELAASLKKSKWKQPEWKKRFKKMTEDTRDNLLYYFEKGAIFWVTSFVDPQYNMDLIAWKTPDESLAKNAVNTPRKAKIIINRALYLLAQKEFLEDFFKDMQDWMQREAFDASKLDDPLRGDIKIGSFPFPTTFNKKLQVAWANGNFH